MDSRWRSKAASIIEKVIRETDGRSDSEIRKALRDAYPFGERRYHPYKIWCDEVKSQREAWARRGEPLTVNGPLFPTEADTRQLNLMDTYGSIEV